MTWYRVDDGWEDHPKWFGASDAAVAAWHRGMGYCSRYRTDGFVPTHKLADIAKPRVVDELVERKLWRRVAKGVKVVNYLDHNRSRSQIEDDKERSAERVKRHRAKRKGNGATNGDVTVSDTETEAETEGTPKSPPSRDQHDGRHQNCRQCGTNQRSQPKLEPPPIDLVIDPLPACPDCEGSGQTADSERCDCTRYRPGATA